MLLWSKGLNPHCNKNQNDADKYFLRIFSVSSKKIPQNADKKPNRSQKSSTYKGEGETSNTISICLRQGAAKCRHYNRKYYNQYNNDGVIITLLLLQKGPSKFYMHPKMPSLSDTLECAPKRNKLCLRKTMPPE